MSMTVHKPTLCTVDGEHVSNLATESDHRIANHLTLLVSLVQMQRKALSAGPATMARADVSELLREIAGKIVSVAHLHRTLAHQHHDARVDLGRYLSESCSTLVSSLELNSRVRISRKIDGDCFVAPEQAQSIALIVTEVLMNAIKHAHPTGIPVEIKLVCRRGDGKHLVVEVEDDGIGLPEGFDPMTGGGTGFKIIRSLATSAGAKMSVKSDCLGTSFQFSFAHIECAPKVEAAPRLSDAAELVEA
jgi:two-component sensor histidine kinase